MSTVTEQTYCLYLSNYAFTNETQVLIFVLFLFLTCAAINPCDSNPCKNGAFCQPALTNCQNYQCFCNGCWSGPTCQDLIDPCADNPCESGGTCTATSCTEFQCECPPCTRGPTCAESVNICAPDVNPCSSSGLCFQNAQCTSVLCVCEDCFRGMFCDVDKYNQS